MLRSMSHTHDNNQMISLAEAARHPLLPRRSGGRTLHVSTLYRWATRGVAGRKLRTVKAGRTRCTSETWLREFLIDGLTDPNPAPPSRTARERSAHRAERNARAILGLPPKEGGAA